MSLRRPSLGTPDLTEQGASAISSMIWPLSSPLRAPPRALEELRWFVRVVPSASGIAFLKSWYEPSPSVSITKAQSNRPSHRHQSHRRARPRTSNLVWLTVPANSTVPLPSSKSAVSFTGHSRKNPQPSKESPHPHRSSPPVSIASSMASSGGRSRNPIPTTAPRPPPIDESSSPTRPVRQSRVRARVTAWVSGCHATALSPFFSTSVSSFNDAPRGRFSPRSHWLTKPVVTLR